MSGNYVRSGAWYYLNDVFRKNVRVSPVSFIAEPGIERLAISIMDTSSPDVIFDGGTLGLILEYEQFDAELKHDLTTKLPIHFPCGAPQILDINQAKPTKHGILYRTGKFGSLSFVVSEVDGRDVGSRRGEVLRGAYMRDYNFFFRLRVPGMNLVSVPSAIELDGELSVSTGRWSAGPNALGDVYIPLDPLLTTELQFMVQRKDVQ